MKGSFTLLAPQHVAARLGVSTRRVIQLDDEGKLRALRDSAGRRLYDPLVVDAYVRAREARREPVAAPGPSPIILQRVDAILDELGIVDPAVRADLAPSIEFEILTAATNAFREALGYAAKEPNHEHGSEPPEAS